MKLIIHETFDVHLEHSMIKKENIYIYKRRDTCRCGWVYRLTYLVARLERYLFRAFRYSFNPYLKITCTELNFTVNIIKSRNRFISTRANALCCNFIYYM